eukprot:6329878-Amphidinium_carterae.1
MSREMITTIQTSADGVGTEQQSMERVFQSRTVMLSEHLASVPQHVIQTTQSGRTSTVRTRAERCQLEEQEEVAMPRAKLKCTEHNLRDLAKVAAYEHGAIQKMLHDSRGVYSYVENQARGFGQEETQAARNHRNLEVASETAIKQNRLTLNEGYKDEASTMQTDCVCWRTVC